MKSRTFVASTLCLVALGSFGSLFVHDEANAARYRRSAYRSTVVPAGAPLEVQLDSKVSTENVNRGDGWEGTVSRDVVADGEVVIPAGSPVSGIITSAAQGTHNSRPYLGLAVRRVNVNGRWYPVHADSEPIVGGTKRAKKIGAIAGGAAAGALLGSVVDKGKGTLIGGILGGAAGYGLTRNALRTLQLKPGTVVTFTMREDMVARL